jgi:hypothetical protein
LQQNGLKRFIIHILASGLFLCFFTNAYAQYPGGNPGKNISGIPGSFRGAGSDGTKKDSMQKRDPNEDSITISYRLLADLKRFSLDSVIDEYRRFPVKPGYLFLGNNGAPAKPLLFTPNMNAGWDAGFHNLDLYRLKTAEAGFYRTTKPYAELGYVLGSKAEQVIHLMHTQNIRPDWNAAFVYRTIVAPGYFRNQKNNHSGFQLTSLYQGKRKRYSAFFIIQGNKLRSSDNGGIKTLVQLNDPNKDDRYLVETNLNNSVLSTRNPFSNTLESGHYEKDNTFLLRHYYDIGKRDSIQVNDTTINYLFYPKLRLQHTFSTSGYLYTYVGLKKDTLYYKNRYGIPSNAFNTANFEKFDRWKEYVNDFSLYQFPDTKNQQQYIHAGIAWQLLKGDFGDTSRTLNNIFVHGGYRNRTRNRKWDIDADGKLYLTGYNAGDYEASVHLVRALGKTAGSVEAGLKNTNRTPSFIFYSESSFNLQPVSGLKKENITQLYASFFNEKKQQRLNAGMYVVANYTNWLGYRQYGQENGFNLLYAEAAKKFRVKKNIYWHASATAQKIIAGNPDINLPLFFTRHRLAYEGNLGKKNLRLAMGLEVRYTAPYKPMAWSPLTAQFIFQDTTRISNLPEITAYLHFSIKGFNLFVRAENLNTAHIRTSTRAGIKFNNHNFSAPLYPDAGMVFRMGIYWRFVN